MLNETDSNSLTLHTHLNWLLSATTSNTTTVDELRRIYEEEATEGIHLILDG